jgi:exodeoxyribonuclease VII large subunit
MNQRAFSVTELNEYIKNLMEADRALSDIYVRGELSNYKIYPSGHHYFTMKDSDSSLRCVMFKSSASKLRFNPESGMRAVAFGRVAVYPRDGTYQLYVNDLQPDGIGDLALAYEQLKEKLQAEGLFEQRHKKPLPAYPDTIAVITSSAGAAVRDIIRVLGARWPLSGVKILPVRVQGAEAPAEIAGALNYVNRHQIAELIITGRGGGSLEDLWAFNDERVVRAIFASSIPVISAVGHEPDVTLSDFAADLRAATPSNAAELAVPDINEVREALLSRELRLAQSINGGLRAKRELLGSFAAKRVLQDPKNYIDDKRLLLDHLQERLSHAMSGGLHSGKERFASLAAALDAMSPLKVLGRGYAIARKSDGAVIKSAKDVEAGERIAIRLREDEIKAVVVL